MTEHRTQRIAHGPRMVFVLGALWLVGAGGWAHGQDAVQAEDAVALAAPVTKVTNAPVPATAPKPATSQKAAKADAANPGGKDGKTLDKMQVIAQQDSLG